MVYDLLFSARSPSFSWRHPSALLSLTNGWRTILDTQQCASLSHTQVCGRRILEAPPQRCTAVGPAIDPPPPP